MIPFALCFMNIQCEDDINIYCLNEICDETIIIGQDLYYKY